MFSVKPLLIICLIFVLASCTNVIEVNSQGADFIQNINQSSESIVDDTHLLGFFNDSIQPIKEAFRLFPAGKISPDGWILEMMKEDLHNGIVGHLDKLYPGISNDDLFYTTRRGGLDDVPNMGDLVLTGEPWEKSIMWWNAETTGNWWDGYIRHAFLTGDSVAIRKSNSIITNLLDSQDPDGYIGIYKPNLRYRHEGSNGELWAQTTAFRAMLAYYEFTKNQLVLEAVEKAIHLTMTEYGEDGKSPFQLKNAFGGVTHGLMMTDVCEALHRITGDIDYLKFATHLYKEFSSYNVNRSFNDLRYPQLVLADSLFTGHGAHTYEHIRAMTLAYFNTGYPQLEKAYTNMLEKLNVCVLPSGAGHADEWISGKIANPSNTATEFCAMLELRNSYGSLFQKTGNIHFADAIEKLTFNAMLGSRNDCGTAIAYSKLDNCFSLDGYRHESEESKSEPRYKYSPTHSEPAVCCTPNFGRNLPYYIDQMYLSREDAILVSLYGPSVLATKIGDNSIEIRQDTKYPWSDRVTITVKTEKPINHTILFRKPQWTKLIEFQGVNDVDFDGEYYAINNTWDSTTSFSLRFVNPVKELETVQEEFYYQAGPLVYSYDIPHDEETIKAYSNTSFRDYYCTPQNDEYKYLSVVKGAQAEQTSDTTISLEVINIRDGSKELIELKPMGQSILRRVTFNEYRK